jgi:hypothetical protein
MSSIVPCAAVHEVAAQCTAQCEGLHRDPRSQAAPLRALRPPVTRGYLFQLLADSVVSDPLPGLAGTALVRDNAMRTNLDTVKNMVQQGQ